MNSLNVACASLPRHPGERFACSCSYGDSSSLHWMPHTSRVVLRSRGVRKHNPIRRRRCSNVVSYQGVAENEAEGNETSPSSPTLDRQKRDQLWRQLQGSLQHWRQELRDRGSLQLAKELLASTETRLKKSEANKVLKLRLQSLKPPPPATLWSSVHPSIKWPALTFGIFYLAVSVFCGKVVSDNLWHVWILGPLAMSFYIQAGIYVGGLYRAHAAPRAEVLVDRSIQLLSDIRSDKLKQNMQAGLKNLSGRRAAAVHYLRSRAPEDAKQQLIRFALWLYEKYEDVIDLLWPSWRIFIRFLANLF